MKNDPTIAQALRHLEKEASEQQFENDALAAQYKALWSTAALPAEASEAGLTSPPSVYGIRQQPSLKDRVSGLVISGWPAALSLSFLSLLAIDFSQRYWSPLDLWGTLLFTLIVTPAVLWLLRTLFGSQPKAESSRKRRGLWCLLAPALVLSMSMLWQVLENDPLLRLFLELPDQPIPFSFKLLALLDEFQKAAPLFNYLIAWLVGILAMIVTLAWSRRVSTASPWLKPTPTKRWSRIAGMPIAAVGLAFFATYMLLAVTCYSFFHLHFRAQASKADIDELRAAFLERRDQREATGLSYRHSLSTTEILSKNRDPKVHELLLLLEEREEQERKHGFDLSSPPVFLESLLPHLEAIVYRPMSPELSRKLIELIDEKISPHYGSLADLPDPQTQSRLILLQLELLNQYCRELPSTQTVWPKLWGTFSVLEKLLESPDISPETLRKIQQQLKPLRLTEKQLYIQLRLSMLDELEVYKNYGYQVFSEPSFDIANPADSVMTVARRAYQLKYWKALTALAAESTDEPARFTSVEKLFDKIGINPELGLFPVGPPVRLSLRLNLCLAAIELRLDPKAVNKIRDYDSRLVLSHKRLRYTTTKPWSERYIPSVTLP